MVSLLILPAQVSMDEFLDVCSCRRKHEHQVLVVRQMVRYHAVDDLISSFVRSSMKDSEWGLLVDLKVLQLVDFCDLFWFYRISSLHQAAVDLHFRLFTVLEFHEDLLVTKGEVVDPNEITLVDVLLDSLELFCGDRSALSGIDELEDEWTAVAEHPHIDVLSTLCKQASATPEWNL